MTGEEYIEYIKKNAWDSGSCGENLRWFYVPKAELYIEGSGEMTSTPWQFHRADIKYVLIGDGCTSIADGAFEYCMNLYKADIAQTVEYIGERAFASCHAMEGLELPKKLKVIGKECFYGAGVKRLEIPENVSEIRKGTFESSALAEVILPAGLKRIEACAFAESSLEILSLPDGLEELDATAFYFCTELEDLEIPEYVKIIGEDDCE